MTTPSDPAGPRWTHRLQTWLPVLVGLLAFLGLLLQRQLTASDWVPRGSDWDSWLMSAIWWTNDGLDYPGSRWPSWGTGVALLSLVLPGVPVHLAAILLAQASVATATGAAFALGRHLGGLPAGLVAALLVLAHPAGSELAAWTNGYPLLLASSALALALLVQVARRGSLALTAAAGAALAICQASMASALSVSVALWIFGLGAVLLAAGSRLKRLGLFVLPVALWAGAHVAFPAQLAGLAWQVDIAERMEPGPGGAGASAGALRGEPLLDEGERPRPGPPVPGGGVTPGSEPTGPRLDEGYVFGRNMGPSAIMNTLALARRDPTSEGGDNHIAAALPGARLAALASASGLVLVGVRGLLLGIRRRKAWLLLSALGVGLTGASLLPSLGVHNAQVRFLTPALVPLAVGLACLPSLLPHHRLGRWLPLLAVPLALAPMSPFSAPWTQKAAFLTNLANGGAEVETRVWYDLEARWSGVPLVVVQPVNGGLLALEGRPVEIVHGEGSAVVLDPEERLLWPVSGDGGSGDAALLLGDPPVRCDDWKQRSILQSWPLRKRGQHLVLIGLAGEA